MTKYMTGKLIPATCNYKAENRVKFLIMIQN